MSFKPCLLIPFYNHHTLIDQTLQGLADSGLPCLLINDGSDAECLPVLTEMANKYPWLEVLHLAENQGKGGAVMHGFAIAERRGFSHALQIDADNQHNAADIPKLLEAARQHPNALITGQPIYDQSVPKGRLYGRYITHLWVWINTLSFQIKDAMLGFRVYPLAETLATIRNGRVGARMDFDIEIMVRMHWRGVPVINIPTQVRYPEDGVSHFDVWRDNVTISKMHARLFFGMLIRFPWILYRRWSRP